MTLGLLEAAIDALYAYLSGNIAAKLNVIDARHSDFTLEDIKAWYQGALPFNYPEVPSVTIAGRTNRLNRSELGDDTIEVQNYIDVIVIVGDADPETRFRRLCRYALAVVELLKDGEATYGYTHYFEDEIGLSDILATPDFLQAVRIPIRLWKDEDY